MALELIGRFLYIQGSTATYPVLNEVVLGPVFQDGRKLVFQRATVYPCFGRRATNGVAYQAYRYLQAILEHLTEIVGNGRELTGSLRRANGPSSIGEVLQMVERVEHGCLPLYRIGTPTRLHVEEANLVVGRLRDIALAGSRPAEVELHVRLARAEPHLACQHIIIYPLFLACRYAERVRSTGFQRVYYHAPLAVGGSYGLLLLSGNGHGYLLSGIGCTMDGERLCVLEHHVVSIHVGHLQATELSGDALIYGLGQDGCTLGIGVNGIFEDVRIRIERFMEVDELNALGLGYALDGQLDFGMPVAGARFETPMAIGQRSHACQEEAHLRVHLAEGLHERTIVANELVAIVGPVARVGIIDAQVDDHNVAGKGQGILVFLLLGVRAVSVVEQGSSGLAEVAHFVCIAQHSLQLHGVSVHFAVGHTRSVGNAIAHASHFNLLLCPTSTSQYKA